MTPSRAGALALAFVGSVGAVGCGPKSPAAPPSPPPVELHLSPACDLAAAAGLEWLVEAKPREIAAVPDLIPAIALVIPESRFTTFAATHGGIDVRQIQDLCIAQYSSRPTSRPKVVSLLTIARVPIDPARVESTFTERMTVPGGRSVVVQNPPVVRQWGDVNGEAQALTLFGRELVALEQSGRAKAAEKAEKAQKAESATPLRAAEAFAQGKLKRATPALKGAALARAADILGDAPVRAFMPGPFDGAEKKDKDVNKDQNKDQSTPALGGLLRASTAVAASAKVAGPSKIALRIVLTGAWGKDAQAAADRLIAAANVVAETALGRLLGLDHPIVAPTVQGTPDALILDATIDGMALARGIHDALDAEVADIMRP